MSRPTSWARIWMEISIWIMIRVELSSSADWLAGEKLIHLQRSTVGRKEADCGQSLGVISCVSSAGESAGIICNLHSTMSTKRQVHVYCVCKLDEQPGWARTGKDTSIELWSSSLLPENWALSVREERRTDWHAGISNSGQLHSALSQTPHVSRVTIESSSATNKLLQGLPESWLTK